MVDESNDETSFPHKLLLTNTQVLKNCKTFSNGSSANIKFLKSHFSKMMQLGGFLGRLLRPLLKAGLSVIWNILKPLSKSVLVPLELTTATLATDAAVQKKIFGSGTINLVFSNKHLNDVMKTELRSLIKGVKGTYIKYVGGGARGFCKFFKKNS